MQIAAHVPSSSPAASDVLPTSARAESVEKLRLLLRPEEVAEALGVSLSQVWVLLRERRIESLLIGRSRRVSIEALQAFIAECQRAAEPPISS
jgi:excisionase family DNA binding protein